MAHPKSTADLRFFDPRSRIEHGENRLPHWHQPGVVCFVTFRLADSIPQEQLRAWTAERRHWLARNPPPHTPEQAREHDDQFTARIEAWLDQGAGSCALREVTIRECVSATLMHCDGGRYDHHAWAVMPNHVHVLFSPLGEHPMESLVRSWKGISARAANRHTGRTGEFWMRDYYDRLVRDAGHFWRCARYIRCNPEKARLSPPEFTLFEAPFVRAHLDAEAGTHRSGGTPAAGPAAQTERRQECRRSALHSRSSAPVTPTSPRSGGTPAAGPAAHTERRQECRRSALHSRSSAPVTPTSPRSGGTPAAVLTAQQPRRQECRRSV